MCLYASADAAFAAARHGATGKQIYDYKKRKRTRGSEIDKGGTPVWACFTTFLRVLFWFSTCCMTF